MPRPPFDPDRAVGAGARERPDARQPMSVAELTQRIRDAIERSLPPTLVVVGELSNFKRHSSGHCYFTLKDDASEIAGVMWRSDASRLKFDPTDGLDVVVTGSVSVYERSGRYQLYARKIEPRGVGAAELAFRQLCEKLKREGLFDAARKRQLPAFPLRIAVITSPTGAAVQDIIDTLRRRFACAAIYLVPVLVQGPAAARSIADAIQAVNRRSRALGAIDVLIVGRGGGSAEDLAAFNDEAVARAIASSKIPIVSAVGHETDITIADLVADVRAATPTAAAELAVPDTNDVLDEFDYRGRRLTQQLRNITALRGAELSSVMRRRCFHDPSSMPRDARATLNLRRDACTVAMTQRLPRARIRIEELAGLVQRLHPERFVVALAHRLSDARHRLVAAWDKRLENAERRVDRGTAQLDRVSPATRVAAESERLAELERRLHFAIQQRIQHGAQRVAASEGRLTAMGYRSVLSRGFSITRTQRGHKVVRSAGAVAEGARLVTELADGTIESKVVDANQAELFD